MRKEHLPNPRLAVLLSFVINGLGQVYNGEIRKGLLLIFLSGTSLLALVLGAVFFIVFLLKPASSLSLLVTGIVLFFAGLTGMIITGIYSISDAYRTAVRIVEEEHRQE